MYNIDAHLDVGWKITKYGNIDLSKPSDRAINLPTMKLGNLDGGVFVLYLSDKIQDELGPAGSLDELQHQYNVITDFKRKSKLSIYIGIEGGRLINNNLNLLNHLAKWNITYLTLVHNKNLEWIDSATDVSRLDGITVFGKNVISTCENLHILVDISHASELAAIEVIDNSTCPVIASHSGCKGLNNHPRNMSNLLMRLVKSTDGVIGIPFVRSFLGDYTVAEHIDYAVQRIGVDHIGIGSDLDGADCVVDSASEWEHWKEPLVKKGYTQWDINKIGGANWSRLYGRSL